MPDNEEVVPVQVVQHNREWITTTKSGQGKIDVVYLNWWQFSDDHQVQVYSVTNEFTCTCGQENCQHIKLVQENRTNGS